MVNKCKYFENKICMIFDGFVHPLSADDEGFCMGIGEDEYNVHEMCDYYEEYK